MALPEVTALSDRIEQLTTIADPAERDRAMAVIERDLTTMLTAVGIYRGDAQTQLQLRGDGGDQSEQAE
jgi:hypothetical protein